MTSLVAASRDRLSEFWHENMQIWQSSPCHCFASDEDYLRFAAAKDWLQDTAEALLVHRKKGFSTCPYEAYIELSGVLQSLFIQQDALSTMYKVVHRTKKFPNRDDASAWGRLRNIRNRLVGHPTEGKQTDPEGLVVIGREPKSYELVRIMAYPKDRPVRPEIIPLGEWIDGYDKEAASLLEVITEKLQETLIGRA